MTANPPHLPGPGETERTSRHSEPGRGALSGGTTGILAVTLATLALGMAAAAIAGVVAWVI